MPVFNVRSPDGQLFRVTAPEGATQDEIIEYAQSQMGLSGETKLSAPPPQEGITAALTGGFKRYLSTGETALESLVNPELAAQRGVERAQRLGEQYAPGASLEKVKQAYAERGLFPAVGEAISQIPSALAEQAPQIAATLGSAKLGAMAGTAVAPGVGTIIGGLGGALAPSLMQLYGANIERQAEEKAPEISRLAALGAAAPGAALEVASTFIPLGRNLVGKLLGPNAEKALARGSNEAIERQAQEALTTSLLKGAGVGAAVEIPTEVTQQMLERLQAGLPLTTEDALKEYGEAAYGAGLVGGPFGAAARGLGRPGVRAQYEQIQQEEAARLAVPEEELAQRFPETLPGGFKIEREELGREMAPQGYSLTVEGRDEPLSIVDTQEEADAKFESLTKIRQEERENLLKEEQKINADVQKAKDRLERLEATEQTDTDEYKSLKADLPNMMDESAQKIKDLYDRSQALSKPITVMPFGEVERVNERFKVLGPDAKEIGSFKTLGEAEAEVQGRVGEDTFKQTRQRQQVAKELYKTFVPQMRKFGLGDVGLNIVDRIENGAGGAYLNKLIRVSLEEQNPVQTMRHESLHAMKDLGFFTPQQWKALEERANKQWIKEYLEGQETEVDGQKMSRLEGYKKLGYSQEDIVEEAIADAFGAYDKGAKPPPGMIAALFRKIKNFFSGMGQALRGAGFQSADDIFQQIERGKLKPAKAVEVKPEVEEKLSLAPKGIPQNIWDLHEKAIRADEEASERVVRPQGISPGAAKRNQIMSFRRLNKAVMEFVGGDEQKANDLMVKMNEESSRRERETEEKFSLPIVRGEETPTLEGKPSVDSIGKYFDKKIKDQYGDKLDYNDKASFDRAVKTASEEIAYQLKQQNSGLDWYEQDIKRAFKQTQQFIPQLGKAENRLLFSIMAGIMSPQTTARDNWFIAAKAFEHYVDNKVIPGTNPETGGLWQGGTTAANKKVQLDFLNRMVNDMGQKKAIEWLFQDHTVKEINEFRRKYGNIKTGIDGKLTDMRPGLYAFGPKVGPFVANLNGIHDVTVDKWMTRTFNRYFGTMTGPDGKIVDAPTEPQRRAIKALINEVATNAGIKPYQAQSLLWFYEQRLFTKMGVLSPSYGFSDGAKRFAEARGRGGEAGVSGVAQPTEERVKGERRETTRPEQPVERPSKRGKLSIQRGGDRGGRDQGGSLAPLAGAPIIEGATGPDPRIVEVAEAYAKKAGIPFSRQPYYATVDEDRAKRIAQAYDDMRHAPQDPKVKAAYRDLIEQTKDQYQALVDAGYEFTFFDSNTDPYKGNPWNAMRDLRQNQRMAVYGTYDGYGTEGITGAAIDDNPMLADTGLRWEDQNGVKRPVTANDLFRAVHDAFGHGIEGAGFRAQGEENAWQAHVRLFKGPAVGAITSETRGQNSWLNYGPYGDKNRTAKLEDTVFAEQKTGLMPEWTWSEGVVEEPEVEKGIVLGTKQPGAISIKGSHYGNARVDELDASKYGTGLRGAERRRLDQAYDNRIKKRVYFYVKKDDGTTPTPEAGVGPYVYTQKFDNILAPGAEMSRLFREANGDSNDFESGVIDAGYDGYAVPSMGMMVILNHNVPVNYVGPRAEVGIAKLSLKAPTTPAFKRWFGESQIVNKDGTPKVMYHGLAKDTTDFTRKTARGAPIFLTDDPEFAVRFAVDSYESVARNPQKYLSKEQIDDGVKRAIAAIKKDYGKDSIGKEMIESLKTGNLKDATPEAREYIQKEFINLLPTGPHIMPLYVRAERSFDYQNYRHVDRLKEEVDLDPDLWRSVSEGDWDVIESEEVQEAIQNAGFDSFYVKEHGRKNLAVYDPNQVKSATGNVGTFSRESADVRYSLKNVAFPSVKEAQEAADNVKDPSTAEFKQYIGASQWLNEDGSPKRFFHATTGNFFEFKNGVIYLSETAKDSEKFGLADEDRLRSRIYRALNKDEKLPLFQRAVDKAVEAGKITAEKGETFMRDAKRSIPDFDKYKSIKEEMDAELIALAPERMKIMPLYARAETPFDFRNPDHVNQVVNYIESNFDYIRNPSEQAKQEARERGFPTAYPDEWFKGLRGLLVQGYETTIEQPPVQNALRRLGFDGYVTRKNRTAPLNYAVYRPQQVKSVTGNDGQFSLETKDIRYSLKNVRYTPERFEKLWDESMYTQSDAENKTKGYLAFVDPMAFVKATSRPETFERLLQESEPLDIQRLKAYDAVPFLSVSEKDGEWKINGHEGRHRMLALHDAGYREIPVYIHLSADDAKSIPVKTLKAQFTDAVSSILMAAEVEPLSYANKQKAMEKFTRMDSKVKYSLPTLSKTTEDRMNEVAPQRVDLGWKDRVIGAFKQDYTGLRQRFLNRYETFGVYDRALREKIRKAGGPELLADQSAEFAALQSDLSAGVAASAMGIGDRQGGVPVYRNGFTTIDNSVKGLTEALSPLAKYGDPKIYQRYQFWAGWKRGRRLLREGREQLYTAADAKLAQEIEAAHPEFVQVQKDLIAFNNGIVNYAVQTGVLSRERAQVYTQYADYIPFYRQLELDKTIGPNPFSGISGQKGPKALKGGEGALGDFLENMVRNTQSMINAGMKNAAAQKATKVALEINQVERLPGPAKGLGVDVYTVLENGQLVYYRANDKLFIDALASLNMPDLPFIGFLSGPANVLRNLVTKDPGFMMANLLRDSLSSYVTSGQNVTPIVGTMVNFGKALAGKDPKLQALFNAGVIGGYEFSQNIEQSGETLSADLNRKAGKDAILLRPFKSLWEGLEKGTTASDAATRMAVYERVMKETGNEAEAISKALEVMNFNRRGNNVLIRIASAALPFFNARLQGLDLFYRASTGQMNTTDAAEIKKRFWIRGATMMALSVMYYLSVADDEEYEKQEEETKDNNWIFPSLGIRIPIPFEVGTLFKTMPERITAFLMGNDTGKELRDSTIRSLANTFAFNPIPQTFKPLIEAATNYNFFTMRPIVGQGMLDVAPKFQVGPGTSKTAEFIANVLSIKGHSGTMGGNLLELSPLKVDQVIKGYTGTMGGYLVDVIDAIANEFSDAPKASKRFEQMPVIKRFALDPEARGSVTQFYQLQKSVDTFVRTSNLLEKTARPEEYAKYVQENIGLLVVKDYVSSVEKEMKKLRDTKKVINSSDIPSDEKRDLLVDIGRMETSLTANIKTIKKAVSELK